jgi:hypothetical protein
LTGDWKVRTTSYGATEVNPVELLKSPHVRKVYADMEKIVTPPRDVTTSERTREIPERFVEEARELCQCVPGCQARTARALQQAHDAGIQEAAMWLAGGGLTTMAASMRAALLAPTEDGGAGRSCPKCHEGSLDIELRDYESGVVAPDGARETLSGELLRCRVCGWEGAG